MYLRLKIGRIQIVFGKKYLMVDPNNGHASGGAHPWNGNCKVWGCKEQKN